MRRVNSSCRAKKDLSLIFLQFCAANCSSSALSPPFLLSLSLSFPPPPSKGLSGAVVSLVSSTAAPPLLSPLPLQTCAGPAGCLETAGISLSEHTAAGALTGATRQANTCNTVFRNIARSGYEHCCSHAHTFAHACVPALNICSVYFVSKREKT
jgi:hypothetical protein